MPALDVKICGLSTPGSVAAALAGGANHVGFIFFPASPRNVAPERAAALAESARGRATIVAVTVDADDAFLDAIVASLRPDLLQLHGGETPARVAALKARHRLPVMKAVSVREAADLHRLDAYVGIADRFLLDAKAPAGARLPGGNGVVFDWSLLAGLDRRRPFMLSGGINRDNLRAALTEVRPAGIDVSSGVESAPGRKDERLIREFLADVRRIEQERTPHPA
ncbi:MAG: N-(5'-phosphoribosyl)anthranilate isomerase [Alphaproteobacteria bacterium]|nr:MAG: N-(5'-phosphoribosyl)anthranilate isomerase [Alphaproteobacteria bacterium]